MSAFVLLGSSLTPAFAGTTTLEITGNGADTQNNTNVTSTSNTVVSQTNDANINNSVVSNSSSGGNTADKNTGGSVSVDTGDSKTVVNVQNTANSNVADVKNCNCNSDVKVLESGNGADSKNNAKLNLTDSTVVAQTNSSDVTNKVNASSDTGSNQASKNTGGDVKVQTGSAVTAVDLKTDANSNWAKVGGSDPFATSGSVDLRIVGNGADTHNKIDLALDRDILLQQHNNADVNNWVDAKANTGYNKADKNTGGSVSVDTGNATSLVAADNAVNFNWANIDCDCLTDVLAKVAGNGDQAKSDIKAKLVDDKNVFQNNSCDSFGYGFFWDWNKGGCVNNNLKSDADTGNNKDKSNTGNPGVDPSISTGDAWSQTDIKNSGNSNIFGKSDTTDSNPFEVGGVNINISFSLQDLLNALHIS